MMTYSIAIRTLATNADVLRVELESITRQTVKPDKVKVYIAEGYDRPEFTVGDEEYVWVKKGMVAQRALRYDDIDSDVILLLDDDVELAADSAERMLNAMREHGVDCVAADTFKNQELAARQKIMAFLSNGVVPRCDDGWAFKLMRNGSFSYNNSPKESFCLTETFAGPCWMIKKSVLKAVRLEDELWLERMEFAYGDDAVESYKIFANGFKSGVLYDSGVKNLDAKTSSGGYHSNVRKYYTRSYGQFVAWWRMVYESRDARCLSVLQFSLKAMWQIAMHAAIAVMSRDKAVLSNCIEGLCDAMAYVHSEEYKRVPSYVKKAHDFKV